jgi:uncharacterized damage-inducible protein DinB
MTIDNSSIGAEHRALLRYLSAQRRHVLDAIDGLDDEVMTRPVLPSGWAAVQLLHHLAVDVERFWFGAVIAGDRAAIDGLSENAWRVPPEATVADVIDLYRREAERSDAILLGADLDGPPAWWPDAWPEEHRMSTAREVALHALAETAAHAGHVDAVRELIDGNQWLVLT